jgi:FKBP-type peptidyl-prolyl cis-trans isomerase SlyD
MQIGKDKVVTVDYTLKDDAGRVLDTSEGHGPLDYLHGVGGIVPGLERALEGRGPGDQLHVKVEPHEAYGVRDESLIQPVPRAAFQDVKQIEPGMQFQSNAGGHTRIVTVVGVDDDNVRIDANHPLAGKNLNFDVSIRDVRDATPEEIQHGHVHGPGGHHHH